MRRMFSEKQIKEVSKETIEKANDGTIDKALGLDSNGNLVKGTISGGTQLYKHELRLEYESSEELTEQVLIVILATFGTQLKNDNIDLLAGSSYEYGTLFNEKVLKIIGTDALQGIFNMCIDKLGDTINIATQRISSSGLTSLTWLAYDFSVVSDNVTPL